MKRTKLCYFFALALFPLVLISSSFAKGFLGKRNMFDYDLIGGPVSRTQSFAYTRVKSNHFAFRFGYSRNNFQLDELNNSELFEVNMPNYFSSFPNYNTLFLHVTEAPVFKSNTYSVGFVFSSSFANLDLPVGYFAAYTLYRTKGSTQLHLSVPTTDYSFINPGHSKDIVGDYSFTQIGSSFDVGKTYYIHPGFTISLGIQLGGYLRFSKETFSEQIEVYNSSYSPIANVFASYPYTLPKQIPYSLNLISESPGFGFSFMPFLRFGYLF